MAKYNHDKKFDVDLEYGQQREKEIANIRQKENKIWDKDIVELLDRSDITKSEIISKDNLLQKQSQELNQTKMMVN